MLLDFRVSRRFHSDMKNFANLYILMQDVNLPTKAALPRKIEKILYVFFARRGICLSVKLCCSLKRAPKVLLKEFLTIS